MTRRAWVGSGLVFGVLGGYVAAYMMGQSPETFFTSTLPRLIGAGFGAGLFVLICAGIVAQVSRR